jgi:diguanylate cyclase (GGDEF)-like protein
MLVNEKSIHEMTILIIDNSSNNITLLKALLEKENFTSLILSTSTEDAREQLTNKHVDLILISYMLPTISGVELCKLISEDMKYEDIPIVMLTAKTDMETLKHSFTNGASDYISKPINAVELIARVHSHLIRKQVSDERKNSAITDALTQLYNRRYFDQVFQTLYEKSIVEHKPLTFFMIDIDNFKKYNDNYGHQAGDVALQSVASAIKSQLNRESDYLFRLGGEEFAILLSNTNEAYINLLSSKVHLGIQGLNITHDFNENYGKLTISIGITTAMNLEYFTKFEIYNAADQALYQAKENGRNKSVINNI